MKWFRLETDIDVSEGVEKLCLEFGEHRGFAMWIRLLVAIAKKMDESDKCSYETTITHWCEILKCKPQVLHRFAEATAKLCGTCAVASGNLLRIEIPKLLEKRDFYTKRFEHASNKVRPKEVDTEVEVHKESKSHSRVRRKAAPASVPPQIEMLRRIMLRYPRKDLWEALCQLINGHKEADLKKRFDEHVLKGRNPQDYAAWIPGSTKLGVGYVGDFSEGFMGQGKENDSGKD